MEISKKIEKILDLAYQQYQRGGSNQKIEFEEYLITNSIGKQFTAKIANLISQNKKSALKEMVGRIIEEEKYKVNRLESLKKSEPKFQRDMAELIDYIEEAKSKL